jgi:hypothetical protein
MCFFTCIQPAWSFLFADAAGVLKSTMPLSNLIHTWKIFMELPPKTLLNSGHRLCGMELEHTKCFLGLSRHFTAIPTVALIVATDGVTSLLQKLLKFSFQWCLISACRLVFVE